MAYFIHPPNPAPRKITVFHFSSTTLSPLIFKIPLDILGAIPNVGQFESGESGAGQETS
jgi:hypothetical protein